MLARRDQENLVHSHQVTAATKPLNQGVRQLQPKTPGNRASKTPFKIPLRDENEPAVFGKKGNGGGAGIGKEAFVTPLGPRNRAPLGAKTTNAKTGAFKTPGLQPETLKTQKTKHRGSSTKKPKKAEIQVQQAQPQVFDASEVDDVPDVEYAPPKPKELPDDPEDITYDTTFPQFQGRNITRGWGKIYYDGEVGEDGLTARQRKFQQDSVAYDKIIDETIQKQVDNIKLEDLFSPEEPDMLHQVVSKQLPRKKTTLPDRASTLKSRNAAAALSRPGSAATARSDTARTSSTTGKSKNISSLLPSRRKTPSPPANASTARHAAAAASSRTTVGYSKGRTVSSTLQNKTPATTKSSQQKTIIAPQTYVQLYGTPPIDSEMWVRCKDAGCLPELEVALGYDDDAAVPSLFEEDEETQNFQLTL
ncbi:hypothetical protein UA08_03878 [Talaromyces atroroseus]|uniref:Uncharacterized protein n=1 Tax=Talaromyces atroroseus TaxID=1441469 RepID=A0A225AHI9_TALAT|nr:hypothetical protein UA08_03878 [Talaromyces atroroseus]OKL60891.1 hypothetical protein UA08_03878 [Talaromyces atroroseus]